MRLLQSEPTLTPDEVEATEFARKASNGRGVAAAGFLNLTLGVALRSFAPVRAEHRRCANETCGRLFAAGEGPRQALYCSAACRHAQAQREFRRRKRETIPS